jgi:hypothetical protein
MSQKATLLRKQTFRIITQDPAVKVGGHLLTASAEVPVEELAAGPWGHRVQVVDFDASTQTLYRPAEYRRGKNGLVVDAFANASDDKLPQDPRFHAQNVCAIVMRMLTRYEFAPWPRS